MPLLIKDGEKLLAIIVKNEYKKEEGVHFFTPGKYSQQIAYMHHKKGKIIKPHIHNIIVREVKYTQEVLIIKSGVLQVDFYTDSRKYIESYILKSGDIIILISGGHGFKVLEELEMFEVKQGPYMEGNDKIRFESVIEEPLFKEEDYNG